MSNGTGKRFSLYMPSKRSLALSRNSIDTMMAFAGDNGDLEVIICDNSDDEKKRDYIISNYNERVIYLHNQGFGAAENVMSGLNRASGDFVMMCADDDVVLKMSAQCLSGDRMTENTVLVRPTSLLYDKVNGSTRLDTHHICGGTARSRIDRYLSVHGFKNTTYYSFVRRDIAVEAARLASAHPVSASGYYDWAMVLSYVAFGDLVSEHRMIYAYDESKWSDPTSAGTSLVAAFEAAGFGPHTADFLWFLVAVDSFLFICRKGSPLDRMEALEAGIAAFSFYLEMFLGAFETNRTRFSADERREIGRITSIVDVKSVLDVAIGIIDAHSAELGRMYREFYREAIGCDWGHIL